MKHFILVSVLLCTAIFLFGCQESAVVPTEQAPVSLSKPAPTLEGHLVCDFSFDNPPVFWFGTITFGEVTYGAYFISTAPPRDYSAADPFTEYLVFYDLVTGDEYFRGLHDGMFVFKDIEGMPVNFTTHGEILEASGPFEGWAGRGYFSTGLVTWEIPEVLPAGSEATVRFN